MTSANAVTSVEQNGVAGESELYALSWTRGRIALVEVDGKRQVIRWSAAAGGIFGWQETDIIGLIV